MTDGLRRPPGRDRGARRRSRGGAGSCCSRTPPTRSGTRLDGRHAGTFGSAGGFSFFSNKNLAVGEGGVVVTDDDDARGAHAAAALARDDDAHVGPPPRPRVGLRRRRARLQLPHRRAARRARHAPPRAARRGERAPRTGSSRAITPSSPPVSGVALRAPAAPSRARGSRTTCSRSCSTRASTATRSATRCTSAASRRACTTRPSHRFSIYARRRRASCRSPTRTAARAVTLPLFAHMTDEQLDAVVDAVTAAIADSRVLASASMSAGQLALRGYVPVDQLAARPRQRQRTRRRG